MLFIAYCCVIEHDGNSKNSQVCVGAFQKLSGVYYSYLSPGLDIIMKCFVCRVHYCYSRAGEVIHGLISHLGESLVDWDLWFIQAFRKLCFFYHFNKMTTKEKCLWIFCGIGCLLETYCMHNAN